MTLLSPRKLYSVKQCVICTHFNNLKTILHLFLSRYIYQPQYYSELSQIKTKIIGIQTTIILYKVLQNSMI